MPFKWRNAVASVTFPRGENTCSRPQPPQVVTVKQKWIEVPSLPVPLERHAPSPSSLLGRKGGSSGFYICSLLSAGAARKVPAASYLRRASEPLVLQTGQSHCSKLIAAEDRYFSRGARLLRWCPEESGKILLACLRCSANDALFFLSFLL